MCNKPLACPRCRYVTPSELETMMGPDTGLSWSPWFRIIAARFLRAWWADLDGALVPNAGANGASSSTNRHLDLGTVHHIL